MQARNHLSGVDLHGITEIVLWDPANWVSLSLANSERPSLKIQGNEAMVRRYRCFRKGTTLYVKLGGDLFDRIVDAFTTSLTRKHIQVEVMIGSLERVRATGMVELDLEGWRKEEPVIHLASPTALWRSGFPAVKP